AAEAPSHLRWPRLIAVEVASVQVLGQLALAARTTLLLGLFELALALLDFALRLQTSLLGVGALGEVGRRLAVLLVRGLAAFTLVLVSLVVHDANVATERPDRQCAPSSSPTDRHRWPGACGRR